MPDLDHTDYLLMLGANPYASNGSLCTAPDFPGRLEALRARGGRLVVVDPRRSRTARAADEWVAIRPGTDAHLLMGLLHVLFADGLVDVGDHVSPWLDGLDRLAALARPFAPEAVAPVCGIEPGTIRRLAHELAESPTAAVYGRIGTCTQAYGTTASWLVDAVNIVTGNLDRRGGVMFALPAAGGPTTRGTPGTGSGFGVRPGKHPGPRVARRCSANTRWSRWRRRSTPLVQAASRRCSRWPGTRSCPPRTRPGWTRRSQPST